MSEPPSPGTREENKGQQPVANDDNEDQAGGSLQNLIDAPGPVPEHREADQHGNRGGRELRQNGYRQRGPLPAHP